MDLEKLRQEIDEIDSQMCDLFARRMQVVSGIGKYKKENNMPVLDPAREREVINRQTACVDESMAMYVKLLYNTIFDISWTDFHTDWDTFHFIFREFPTWCLIRFIKFHSNSRFS